MNGPFSSRRCRTGLLVAICLAPVLAGCRSSSRQVLYDPRWYCLTMQSVVGETADQDGAGRTGAIAVTTNRDDNCEAETPAYEAPWAYFQAEARLAKRRADGSGTFICAVALDQVTYTSPRSEAQAGVRGDCESGTYFTHGVHVVEGSDVGLPRTGHTYSPDGYNA